MKIHLKTARRLACGCAAAALLFPSLTLAADGGVWLTDPTSGCQVWSTGDGKGESVTWSGACREGHASGQGTLNFHDAKGLAVVYDGEMVDGKVDGKGYLVFRNAETGEFDAYLGNFEDGKPLGDGIFESREGWRIEGEFDGAFDTVTGTLRLKDGSALRGNFVEGDLVGPALAYYEKDGESYFGDVLDGKRDGLGTLVHANDDVYVGEFKDGVANGAGTYEDAGGGAYIGQFESHLPNGFGVYVAANGDAYQGRFIDGKADGIVLVTKADGSQSTETWKNGEKVE